MKDQPALRWRVLFLILLCFAGTTFALYTLEMVTGRYVTGGIPPLPATAVLVLLCALGPKINRIAHWLGINRKEVVAVYMALAIGVPVLANYGFRAFLPHTTALRYFATPENGFAEHVSSLPRWVSPVEEEVIRTCYEGAEDQAVPWKAWWPSIVRWSFFLGILFLATHALVRWMEPLWGEKERLAFPLLKLPEALTEGENPWEWGGFFRDPIVWVGMGISLAHNLLNIAHAVNPSVASLGFDYDLGALFTERPLTYLRPLVIYYKPEALGFGYFVPLDVSFSVWFLYLVMKTVKMLGIHWGVNRPGFPFFQHQSLGAYGVVAGFLVWSRLKVGKEKKPILAVLLGFGALVGWFSFCGMNLLLALPFALLLFMVVLVFMRIRVEVGAPFDFIYPYGLVHRALMDSVGIARLKSLVGVRSIVVLTCHAWLDRHHLVPNTASYQMEGIALGSRRGLSKRQSVAVLSLGFAAAVLLAWGVTLKAYYAYGQNLMEAKSTQGDVRTQIALGEYRLMAQALQRKAPPPPNRVPLKYAALGAVITASLYACRRTALRFPLHPLGFILATCYGDLSPFWAPFFMVFLAKIVILKLGGVRLYRKLAPAALGLALGHFIAGGMIWPLLSLKLPDYMSDRYHIWFG